MTVYVMCRWCWQHVGYIQQFIKFTSIMQRLFEPFKFPKCHHAFWRNTWKTLAVTMIQVVFFPNCNCWSKLVALQMNAICSDTDAFPAFIEALSIARGELGQKELSMSSGRKVKWADEKVIYPIWIHQEREVDCCWILFFSLMSQPTRDVHS